MYKSQVVATKPSPAIITTVISAWSFLLTTMDLLAMRKRWSGDVLNVIDCSFNDKCYLSVSKDRLALLQVRGKGMVSWEGDRAAFEESNQDVD
nr:hypothetical protein [Tanacetum cinerariifolium]